MGWIESPGGVRYRAPIVRLSKTYFAESVRQGGTPGDSKVALSDAFSDTFLIKANLINSILGWALPFL